MSSSSQQQHVIVQLSPAFTYFPELEDEDYIVFSLNGQHPSASSYYVSAAGASFVADGSKIVDVRLALICPGSAGANETVSACIYASNGTFNTPQDVPVGDPLATSQPVRVNTFQNSSTSKWVDFVFTGSSVLKTVKGQHYYVVLKRDNQVTTTVSCLKGPDSKRRMAYFQNTQWRCGSGVNVSEASSILGTVFGEWPKYSVVYDGNGNTGGAAPVDEEGPYDSDSVVTVLGNLGGLVKSGFVFKGWALSSSAVEPDYVEDNTFVVSDDVVLYAVWAPLYSVTYNGNGHTGGDVPVEAGVYEQGTSVAMAANPGLLVKTNYTFLGWSTTSSATAPDYAVSGSTVTPPNHQMGNAAVVFYAVWQENPKYSVTYNGNTNTSGAAPNDPNAPYYTDSIVTVLGQGTLVKTNWTFKGWSTNQTATTEQYTQGSTFTISAATVLFAVWTENPKYTVVYDGNGATSGSAPVDPDSSYYTGSTVTVLGQGSLLKANHNFIGWSTTQNAISAQFTQGQTFTITENTWLFAVWEEYPKYSVVYDGNGSTDGVTPSDSGMYYQGSSVTVLANTGGLTKTGYVFKGWATSSAAVVTPDFVVSGSTVTPSTFTMGSANVTLYAVWEEDLKYSVTYLGNGADSGDTPVDTGSPYESGTTVTVLGQNTLQKTGYIFLGWSTNSAASSPQYTAGQKFVISQNLVFYAVWLPDDEPPPPTFHVYYNSNAPAGVTVTGEVPQDDTLYLEEQTVTVLANTGGLACAVYRFLGWAKVRNLVEPAFTVDGDTVSPPTFVMAATDVTLYAVWQPIPLFTVTYQPNGATGGSVPVDGNTYVEGATVTVLGSNTLTKTNYTFIGWNVNSSSTTALYVQNETFTITGSSVVLYAIWRENTKYSVTYSGNGASDGTAPVDVNSPYYAGSQVVVLNRGSLALAGYEFLGWSTNNTATEAEYVAGDVFQLGTANVTLHAIWRLIPLTYSVTYRANWSDGGESGLGSPPLDTNSYLANSTVEVQANPNNLTLSGYRLLGWSANQYATAPTYVIIGDTVSPASFTIGAADVVLYAVWEQIMYYRTIYHDNGSEGGVAPVDGGLYEQGDRVVVLANSGNLFRVGYVFVGWALSASAVDAVFVVSNSGYVEPASFIMAIVDVHLYPVWQQVVMYTVTYHPNGADSGEVPENQNRFMPGSLVSVRANSKNLAKVGYIFLGWATTASATHPDYTVDGEIVSPGSFSITADVVLFAVWLARIIYKIAYNANWPDDTAGSGVVPVDNTVYYFEDFALVQANPGQLGKTGYSFTGWIYNNQMFHINGSTVTPSTVQVVEGVVFFGVWTLNEPQKYVHYGLLENAKVLIRTAYVADFNPPRDELISPVLSQCLVMGSAWVDGVVSAAGVKLPFVKVPEILAHICELYAAGRYLQRSIPEEKTHPYIMEAQQYLTQWLEQAKENGLVEETIRPPAIALGRFHS